MPTLERMWWRRACLLVAVLAVPVGIVVSHLERLPVTEPADPRDIVLAANARRTRGFADPRRADPATWYDPSCPCHAADRAQLAALSVAGRALVGPGPEVVRVTVLALLPERTVLDVVDRIPPYAEVDPHGGVVRRWPGRGERQWRVVLVSGKITNWRPA